MTAFTNCQIMRRIAAPKWALRPARVDDRRWAQRKPYGNMAIWSSAHGMLLDAELPPVCVQKQRQLLLFALHAHIDHSYRLAKMARRSVLRVLLRKSRTKTGATDVERLRTLGGGLHSLRFDRADDGSPSMP